MIWIYGYKTKPLSDYPNPNPKNVFWNSCQMSILKWNDTSQQNLLWFPIFFQSKNIKRPQKTRVGPLRFRIYNPHDFVAVLKKTHGNTNCRNDRRMNETHFGSKLVASTKIWLRKGLIEEPRMQGMDSPLKLWTTNNHNPLHHPNRPSSHLKQPTITPTKTRKPSSANAISAWASSAALRWHHWQLFHSWLHPPVVLKDRKLFGWETCSLALQTRRLVAGGRYPKNIRLVYLKGNMPLPYMTEKSPASVAFMGFPRPKPRSLEYETDSSLQIEHKTV